MLQSRVVHHRILARPTSATGLNEKSLFSALRQLSPAADITAQMITAALCRYCCKSLFAQVIKNSAGRRRDFRAKMWGTSSPDEKLTGDLGNVIEATRIGARWSDRLMAGKLSPDNF